MFYNTLTPYRNFLASWPHLAYQAIPTGTGQKGGSGIPGGITQAPFGPMPFHGYSGPGKGRGAMYPMPTTSDTVRMYSNAVHNTVSPSSNVRPYRVR